MVTKEIYFSEIHDEYVFASINLNAIIIDKEKITKNVGNKQVKEFLILDEVTKAINNSDLPIIYLLYTSNPDSVMNTIKTCCEVDDGITIQYNLILESNDNPYKKKYKKIIIK
jgi:hypothetical protein